MLPIFLIFLFASPDASLAKAVIPPSYAQHCGSIAPESSPTKPLFGASNPFRISNGFFSAGSPINNYLALSTTTNDNTTHGSQSRGIFHFQPGQVHLTNDDGTRQLEGTLVLVGERVPWNMSKNPVWTRDFDKRRRVVFKLSGFWSEAKGKLCMVGTGEIDPSQQDQVASQLAVVLKLEFPKESTITTSIIKGSIESLDTDNTLAYFEPISLLAYAQRKYQYTMAEKAEESCPHLSQEEPVGSDSTSICSILIKITRYESFTSSDLIDFLGFRFLSVGQFVCSDNGKVQLSMALSNKTTFSSFGQPLLPEKSLVAEGVWDSHNSKLCLLACGVIGKEYNSSVVGDCSLGLTFWFPTTFSLKQRSTMVGRMWNTTDNSKNDGNKMVSVHSTDIYSSTDVPGLKYEYTELDRARKYCNIKNFDSKMTGKFPDAQSYMDMRFYFSVRDTKGRQIWGNAQQISTGKTYHGKQYGGLDNGDSMYTTGGTTIPSSSSLADQNRTIWKVGYAISYTIWDGNYTDSVQISAEGIYNSTMGTLCLVGCRQPSFRQTQNDEILNSSARIDDRNLDCEFFIQFQLPPLDSNIEQGKGMITSTRADSDPLFFKPLKVSISLMHRVHSMQIDRMDAEIIMVIISLTLLCACLYVQLCHARKNSTIRPLMSITMLVVLTLGCMVSLILNTEAMLVPAHNRRHRGFFLESGGWIDTVNTIARLITIVALLINFRLLQLAWGSRTKEEITVAISRSAEKKSLMFCLPLYTTGALVAWFAHSHFAELRGSSFYNRRTIFDGLARYVGLLVDNFLLPQIIFSVFSQSKEKVLNPFFYFGVTGVRAAPHVYNAYRAWWYPVNFNSSYIYANPDEDYYSKILDVIIPFGGLLFALIVYLQQRFGGRCFLPKRFKQGAGYELVYVSNI
ncbi:uncharacterized protein LOC144563915 [Carex rostrata]